MINSFFTRISLSIGGALSRGTAMSFREAGRVPHYFSEFWSEFESEWKQVHGPTDL